MVPQQNENIRQVNLPAQACYPATDRVQNEEGRDDRMPQNQLISQHMSVQEDPVAYNSQSTVPY
jgi:hypothetical protein